MKDTCDWNYTHRYFIGKLGISKITMTDALNLISRQVQSRLPAYICAANLHTTVLSQRNDKLCEILNKSLFTLPDGMPLVWYAKLVGEKMVERITGPDLMIRILEISAKHCYSHYFYGDTQQTLDQMRAIISKNYPGTEIKGIYSPPFRPLTDDEIKKTVEDINRLCPTFVWVALGGSKQEKWINRIFPQIDSSILIGVGAAFRFLTGEYRHPPKVIQACCMEGLYWRFFKHPIENIKFHCCYLPPFVMLMIKGLVKRIL
jgi:N-acetylglucosaminyldiphosphoundecaprenol N-acetyl-beta-D-mannosaminyltransferase